MASLRQGARGLAALGKRCLDGGSAASPGPARARAITSTGAKIPPSRPGDDLDLADLEVSTLTAPSPDEATIKAFQEGLQRAREDDFDLPHSRYQYHPPRYNRGPLHPVQSPPSSDPTSREFAAGPFNLPRLRQTFESTFSHDLLALAYEHLPPGEEEYKPMEQLRRWDEDASPYHKNRPRRGPRGGRGLFPIERRVTWMNLPELESVCVHSHAPEANDNLDYLWTAWAAVQAVTGAVPELVRTKNPISQWGTKKGRLAGVKATVTGDRAYEFVDKVVNLVFPKIKDWPGVKGSTGDGAGNLAFGLTPTELCYFPEIEVNYDMYPARMIPGVDVFVRTTAKSDRHGRLLLKALGFPVTGKYVD